MKLTEETVNMTYRELYHYTQEVKAVSMENILNDIMVEVKDKEKLNTWTQQMIAKYAGLSNIDKMEIVVMMGNIIGDMIL